METLRHRAFILTSLFGLVCLASLAKRYDRRARSLGRKLYLAADSRRITGAGRPAQKIREACKIRVRGGLVMAAAGLVDFPDLPDLPGGLSLDRAFSGPANRGPRPHLLARRTRCSSTARSPK
jgi:hypothetical protein